MALRVRNEIAENFVVCVSGAMRRLANIEVTKYLLAIVLKFSARWDAHEYFDSTNFRRTA